MLLDLQNTDEAIRQARQVLARQPDNSMALSHLAHAYRLAEAFDQSEQHARRAIEKDKSNSQAHLWLAEALRYARKFDEAKANYLRFIQLTDFEAKFHEKVAFYISEYSVHRHIREEAAHTARSVSRPANLAHFGLCVCEQQTGNLNLAAKHCRGRWSMIAATRSATDHLGWIALDKYLTGGCDLPAECAHLLSRKL